MAMVSAASSQRDRTADVRTVAMRRSDLAGGTPFPSIIAGPAKVPHQGVRPPAPGSDKEETPMFSFRENRMRSLAVWLVAAAGLALVAAAPGGDDAKKFQGTWEVV